MVCLKVLSHFWHFFVILKEGFCWMMMGQGRKPPLQFKAALARWKTQKQGQRQDACTVQFAEQISGEGGCISEGCVLGTCCMWEWWKSWYSNEDSPWVTVPAPSLDKCNAQELESHLSAPYVNVANMHKASHLVTVLSGNVCLCLIICIANSHQAIAHSRTKIYCWNSL